MINDPSLENAFYFFRSFIGEEKWKVRKELIVKEIEHRISELDPSHLLHVNQSIYSGNDNFGWVLFLLESYLDSGFGQDPKEAARYGLFFQKIGDHLDEIRCIDGITDKINKIISNRGASVESGFFEIIIALLWKRNGWHVKFIPETSVPTPDIETEKSGVKYFVECKKLQSFCPYSINENNHWMRLFLPLANLLLNQKISYKIDFNFLCELSELSDDYLKDLVALSIENGSNLKEFHSDGKVELKIDTLDWQKIKVHLTSNFVKYPSNQLDELVFGYKDVNRNFTSLLNTALVRKGEYEGNNLFVENINSCFAASWQSFSEKAVDIKSRHVKRQLVDATRQLAGLKKGIIHFGIDTLFGSEVEAIRLLKNIKTIADFEFTDEDIEAIFIHHYQTYSPPDQPWYIDETIMPFSRDEILPIEVYSSVVPYDDIEDGVHWKKPPP